MKKKTKTLLVYIPLVTAAAAFILSMVFGGLIGYVFKAAALVCLGIFFLISILRYGKGNAGWDFKFVIAGVLLGALFLGAGGKNIVMAGIDASLGPAVIQLEEYDVYKSSSLKRIFHSYYLEGTDVYGENRRFAIDKDMYQQLDGSRSPLTVTCWEHSGVVKQVG